MIDYLSVSAGAVIESSSIKFVFSTLDRLECVLEHVLYDAFSAGEDRLHRDIARGLDEMEQLVGALALLHEQPRSFTGIPGYFINKKSYCPLSVVTEPEETLKVLCACLDRCKFLLEKSGGYRAIRQNPVRFKIVAAGVRLAEETLTSEALAQFLPSPRLSFAGVPSDYRL
jgi:hypothetical protein